MRVDLPGLPGTDHCHVMGVLNVTPDSFSDGGRYGRADAAVAHGLALWRAGADSVDVGGESTRPGAGRVDAAAELRRVLPVVRELATAGVPVSIDTTRAAVAEAAVAAGAVLVNDVSGGRADPAMAGVVAQLGVPWVLMHSRGSSRDMYADACYRDVVGEVADELRQRVDSAVAAGVDPGRLVVDPGLGFAKHPPENWALLAGLDQLVALGLPVLVGASRKRFLAGVLAGGEARPATDRDAATLATTVLAARAGAWGVRVHDVGPSADAVRVVAATRAAERAAQLAAERSGDLAGDPAVDLTGDLTAERTEHRGADRRIRPGRPPQRRVPAPPAASRAAS